MCEAVMISFDHMEQRCVATVNWTDKQVTGYWNWFRWEGKILPKIKTRYVPSEMKVTGMSRKYCHYYKWQWEEQKEQEWLVQILKFL